MNSSTITVHWHDDNQPVYSATFQPNESGPSTRLITAGGDNNVRVWRLVNENGRVLVEYLSTLKKHTQAVNVVSFDPSGNTLATAGDDGTLITWRLSDRIVKEFGEEDDDIQESWIAQHVFRVLTSEIYDLAWSPDSKYIATGSMDNITRVYDVANNQLLTQLIDHNHYVQGVAWDPRGRFLVTQSADRSVIIYEIKDLEFSVYNKISRADFGEKNSILYHTETLQSFFRRLAFSPDGNILLTPAGVVGEDDNTVFVHTRAGLNKQPIAHLSGLRKPAIAVAFSPIVYQVDTSKPQVFTMDYKMVFAVATQDAVVVYDTQSFQPLGYTTNLHYSTITDLCWNTDGQSIIVTSADGFCSSILFDDVFGLRVEKDFESREVIDSLVLQATPVVKPEGIQQTLPTTPQKVSKPKSTPTPKTKASSAKAIPIKVKASPTEEPELEVVEMIDLTQDELFEKANGTRLRSSDSKIVLAVSQLQAPPVSHFQASSIPQPSQAGLHVPQTEASASNFLAQFQAPPLGEAKVEKNPKPKEKRRVTPMLLAKDPVT